MINDVSISVLTPPSGPLVVADATMLTVQFRVDPTGDSTLDGEILDYVNGLLATAQEVIENECNQRFMTQTVKIAYMRFPYPDYLYDGPVFQMGRPLTLQADDVVNWTRDQALEVPIRPVQSITSITYVDADGNLQTMDSTQWQTWLDHKPPLVSPLPGLSWPPTKGGALAPVNVTATVGYVPGAAPTLASRAIMLAATHWYENRGDKDDRTALRLDFAGLPPGVTRLVNLLRNKEYR